MGDLNMDKQVFLEKLDYFNMVHGVTLRVIGTFGDGDLGFRPQPAVRTARELIFHIYTQEKLLAEAVQQGRFTAEAASLSAPEDKAAAGLLSGLTTVAETQAYADRCHQAAQKILRALSEEDLARPIESPFGTYPAWRFLDFAYDEHWHHRGQLYTYLRLLGKEPPMLYDY
jgi:uncharacterized damage-inducible protein DinB